MTTHAIERLLPSFSINWRAEGGATITLAMCEPYIIAAQQRTDDGVWADAWAEGRGMTLEEAIANALLGSA
ncbi:MAG: hypothetical protein M3220_12995 [Chloroflexota bacterium]|nr:hypothetical protein [Chloroflexota bacterium]